MRSPRKLRNRTLRLALIFAASWPVYAAVFDVTSFGAKGDGKTQNREAINKAVEAAAAAGGGTVDFPAGIYISGSIRLHSHVTLHLEAGSVIEASSEASAYDPPE